MIIDMKKVKFGECIILNQNNHSMILDCGSKNCDKPLKKVDFAYSAIDSLISSKLKNLDLMISHFDEDHYNGILQINEGEIFSKIYLPYYLFTDKRIISTLGYLLMLADNKSQAFNISKQISTLLLKLPKLLKKDAKIHLTCAGDKFKLDYNEFEVLWPSNEYKKFIQNDNEDWKTLIDRILIYTKEIRIDPNYNNFFQRYMSIGDNELLESINDNFTESLIYYISSFDEESISDTERNKIDSLFSNSIEEVLKINEIINEFYSKNTYKSLKQITIRYLQKKYRLMIKDMNSCSIVMQKEDEALFLGDVSSKIIDYLAANKIFHDKYKVIKIQHHATKAYFTKNLPLATVSLISNGGYEKWNISQDFIGQANKIYCTNANSTNKYCEHRNKNSSCPLKCNDVVAIDVDLIV